MVKFLFWENLMKKNILLVVVVLLIGLSGCFGGKKAKKVQHRREKSAQDVAMPLSGNNEEIKIGFFDENMGGFEDIEAYVLDEESPEGKDLMLAHNDELAEISFSLEEPKQQHELATKVVYFDYDSAEVQDDQKSAVDMISKKVVQWEKQGYKVVFKGHSCKWHGTRAYNIALSGQRAQCMADLCNVPKDNIKVFGVGSEEPVIFENTKEGQSPNRRVEVYAIAA